MGSIVSSITGLGGGGSTSGMGYRAQNANIQTPATVDQANQQYGNVNQGLNNQAAFLQAVQAQNGLQNQSNVYNQLQNVANGTGPNPAQAQLAQATGANVANQASLMAGQRGASQNAGLIARQAAQQGANTQQQAAGQGATLQAQQSLNALGQMGSVATNQANQQANATNAYTTNALGAQQNTLGAIGAQNNAVVGSQNNVNTVNGGIAGAVIPQQGNFIGGLTGALGSVGQMFGGGSGSGAAGSGLGLSGMGDTGWAGVGDVAGGAADAGDAGSIGDAATMLAAKGGMIRKMADGGQVDNMGYTTPMQQSSLPTQNTSGPQSNAGKSFMQQEDNLGATKLDAQPAGMPMMAKPKAASAAPASGGGNSSQGIENTLGNGLNVGHNLLSSDDAKENSSGNSSLQWDWGDAAKGAGRGAAAGSWFPVIGTAIGGAAGFLGGGLSYQAEGGQVSKVPAMVSPGEKYLSPKEVEKAEKGANPMKLGEKIPGKPKVGGAKNSYANDFVRKNLDEGGIVLPRSVTQAPDASTKAAHFVAAVLAKNKGLKR